ncbi:MAG: GNAT family N-acetyltransferase [Chloroflexota bacterium]
MSIELRSMEASDYDMVFSLWKESDSLILNADDSRECVIHFLERNPGLSFVAIEQGKMVGAALCGHDGRHGYIHNLVVKKDQRKKGIGKSLVGRCMYELIKIGIHRCHLYVESGNQEGINFWKKLGWEQRVEIISMSQPLRHTT